MLLDLHELIKAHNLDIKGVIHLGAHTLEEKDLYDSIPSIRRVYWIEGNTTLWVEGLRQVEDSQKHFLYNALISDKDGKEEDFGITNNGASSSILPLGRHKELYPKIKTMEIHRLKAITLDTFIETHGIDMDGVNFLNMDIQGAELMALKGFEENLKHIDYIYTEVNIDYVYERCALLPEMDQYLGDRGFKRVEAKIIGKKKWGDAVYKRSKK